MFRFPNYHTIFTTLGAEFVGSSTIHGAVSSMSTNSLPRYLVYLGDCAALSFLQHLQKLIDSDKELSKIAEDVSSISGLEELLPAPGESLLTHSASDFCDLEDLVDSFFASVCPKRSLLKSTS